MHTSLYRDEVRLIDRLRDARRCLFRLRCRRQAEGCEEGGQKQKGIPKNESASVFHNPPTLQIWCVFQRFAIGPEGATSSVKD